MECTVSEDARCNSSVPHSDACKSNLNFSVSIIFLAIEREAKFVLVRILVIGHLLCSLKLSGTMLETAFFSLIFIVYIE